MKHFIILLIFSLFTSNLFSQTVISGTVEQHNGSRLPGVNIYIRGSYDGATSDSMGIFSFKTQQKGPVILEATCLGFVSSDQEVSLTGEPNESLSLVIRMKEAINTLTAVTITAGTFAAGDKKRANILTARDMYTTAGAVGDVYGALQSLPGTTTNGESGRLFVKGGDSNESTTYIDGSLVYAPYTTSAPNQSVRGRFNPAMFSGTIFSTGGYSAEYGQALSSVLLLNTHDMPLEDKIELSVMSTGVGAGGTKRWNTGAATVDVSYSNLTPYMTLVPQNYTWTRYPQHIESAFSIRQKVGKSGLLKLYGGFYHSTFTVKKEDTDRDSAFNNYAIENNNTFFSASWLAKPTDSWTITTAASYTDNTDAFQVDSLSYTKRLQGIHAKSVAVDQISDRIALRLGGELFSKTYHLNYSEANASLSTGFTNHILSGFSEAEIYASTKWVTRLGVRLEYSDYLHRANLSPRLSAAYKTSKFSQFSLAYGWFFQDPSDDYLIYTNKLTYERADHYILSYQSIKEGRTFRMEVYYKDYKNLAKQNTQTLTSADYYSNAGYGYAKGVDIFIRDKKSIKNGDYWLSYSYIDTKRDYRDYPCLSVPGFASKHNFAAVYKHWFGDLRSYLSANFKYSSPRPYNNPNTVTFNGERTKPYRSVDFSWSYLYRQNIILYAAVTNVFGFKQAYGYAYGNTKDGDGLYRGTAIIPGADRFYLLASFITLSRKGESNQIDQIQ